MRNAVLVLCRRFHFALCVHFLFLRKPKRKPKFLLEEVDLKNRTSTKKTASLCLKDLSASGEVALRATDARGDTSDGKKGIEERP